MITINKEDFQNVCYIIEESNYSNLEMPRGSNREMLLSEFAGYDLIEPLLVSPVHIISDRVKIFKEYQNCNLIEFKDGSRKAFRNIANYIKMRIPVYYEKLVPKLMCVHDWIDNFKPNYGFYPGTFDPFHIGHMNTLEKAEKLFDKVIVGIGNNPSKPERSKGNINSVLPFHECKRYYGLMSDAIRDYKSEGSGVTLIRGLRNEYDLNYESTQLRFIKDFMPDLNVIYIPSDVEHDYLSSSAIKGLSKLTDVTRYMSSKYDYVAEYYSREIELWGKSNDV